MLEPMRKPPIETRILSFEVPLPMVDKVMQSMRSYGLREENESVPWREAFNMSEKDIAHTCLRGARHREDLTQKQLSELTGIPVRHISEMENGKRPVGKKNAAKLAEALNCNARVLLSM